MEQTKTETKKSVELSYGETQNNNMALSVQEDGYTRISIHNTQGVKVESWRTLIKGEYETTQTKRITGESKDGKTFYIVLFRQIPNKKGEGKTSPSHAKKENL